MSLSKLSFNSNSHQNRGQCFKTFSDIGNVCLEWINQNNLLYGEEKSLKWH